ncbi:MAG: hypothetical protein JXA03_14870 [Bacteroidales bacterium]|nr:hypothetical protein [Bacteroidales bacterium]
MYSKIISWSNLLDAYHKASRGKRGKPDVAAFEHRLEINLNRIREELAEMRYRPGNYHSFYIHEPKKRLISAAPFHDRVVHHALCNIIEPLFESGFIYDSYANRQGKGTHRALDKCQQCARRYAYVLQCDIKQFFPAIDHRILMSVISGKISDMKVLWLIEQILAGGKGVLDNEYEMNYFPGDDLFATERPRGLPIGNLTSQFWANVYMTPFDNFVKRELGCRAYIRYVDDFLLFHNDKAVLHHWKKRIIRCLSKYRLVIHNGAHPRPVEEGIPFLGFRIFPQHRRLKRRKGIHYRRKLKRYLYAFRKGLFSEDQVIESVRGWTNHAGHGNTTGLRKAMFRDISRIIHEKASGPDTHELAGRIEKIMLKR